MKTADYKLIPMSEITDEAREIAVAWVDGYTPGGSIYPEIAQIQKLASDIMNYAAQQNSELTKELTSLREKHDKAYNQGWNDAVESILTDIMQKWSKKDADQIYDEIENLKKDI